MLSLRMCDSGCGSGEMGGGGQEYLAQHHSTPGTNVYAFEAFKQCFCSVNISVSKNMLFFVC